MDPRPLGYPLGASRFAIHLALLLAGLSTLPAPVRAQSYWYVGIPPESLIRWSPRTPEEAARTPHWVTNGGEIRRAVARASADRADDVESGHWGPLPASGSRYFHDSVLDVATNRLVLFGGFGNPILGTLPDLAAALPLDGGGQWEPLGLASAVSPQRRLNPSVALDPVHHALLVFGGQALDGSGDLLADLWSLSLAPGGTWTRLEPAGPAPAPRRFGSLFFDAPRNRFLLLGGFGTAGYPEAWELRLDPAPAWRALALANETGLYLGAALADPTTGDAWWVASHHEVHPLAIDEDSVTVQARFATEPDSSTWEAPDLLLAGFDPVHRRLLWFEHHSDGSQLAFLDRPSWFSLDAPRALVPVDVAGTAPPRRYLFASSWDAAGGRLLLSGGYDDDEVYFGDAWQMTASTSLPTPVVASLHEARSDRTGVRLDWRVTGEAGAHATVQGSADGVAWSDVGEARWSGADEVSWDGPPLAPAERAAFRLVVSSGGSETRTAPVWVTGPAASALALASRRNPSGPDLALSFTLASDAPARLRLLDAAGRLVAEAQLLPGTREWSLGRGAAPGLYFAELTQGHERRVTKLVTVR